MRSSFWWAITGSNWFRSEHILKEQSDAQNVVSRGCRRLYDCREKRKMAIKNPTARSTWNFSLWWAITGSNCWHSACKADALPAELIAHGDLWGIRTPEPAVKGRCLNRLTNRPLAPEAGFEPATSWLTVTRSTGWAIQESIETSYDVTNYGAENGTRTRDPNLGKVVLYHWATSAFA